MLHIIQGAKHTAVNTTGKEKKSPPFVELTIIFFLKNIKCPEWTFNAIDVSQTVLDVIMTIT